MGALEATLFITFYKHIYWFIYFYKPILTCMNASLFILKMMNSNFTAEDLDNKNKFRKKRTEASPTTMYKIGN